ncbi:rhodanese-like domain-containing protein [Mesoterricola sediminis]|uniref:Rhodanese domain-containing protein n=1 Tax=Mesoterricola sediminis TaxID=2927980 RepID=A0AA48GXY1_9BACT|nr:rhodanese-like domain-containing protein [Mesoterricola sediminis]BDU76440.1 hypothetical protein METESE_13980 [Mesoterricola sediminis]
MADGARPGMVIQGLWFLGPREALEQLSAGAVLVDLRSDALVEMKAFSVPRLVRVPHLQVAERAGDLPRAVLLILADASGVYTRAAARTLLAAGFDRVACLNGGMLAWDQEGLPLVTDPDALLHGDCACVMRSRKDRRP